MSVGNVEIREAKLTDESELVELFFALDKETDFMMMGPGERKLTVEKQARIIEKVTGSDSRVLLVASEKGKLVGFLGGTGGAVNRNQHSIYIAMGVLASHWGRGVGTQLLEALISWAATNNFHRIELTVMEDNYRAKGLYKKTGFEFEGVKRDSLLVNGSFVNEHYMAKLI